MEDNPQSSFTRYQRVRDLQLRIAFLLRDAADQLGPQIQKLAADLNLPADCFLELEIDPATVRKHLDLKVPGCGCVICSSVKLL